MRPCVRASLCPCVLVCCVLHCQELLCRFIRNYQGTAKDFKNKFKELNLYAKHKIDLVPTEDELTPAMTPASVVSEDPNLNTCRFKRIKHGEIYKLVEVLNTNPNKILKEFKDQDIPKNVMHHRDDVRLAERDGTMNITASTYNQSQLILLYNDFFTTINETDWMMFIFVIILIYLVIFTLCSWIIYSLMYYYGQTENQIQVLVKQSKPDHPEGIIYSDGSCVTTRNDKRCLHNVFNFADCFLFMIETASTIGYGNKYITANCSIVYMTFVLFCGFFRLLHAFTIGLVFNKLTQPDTLTSNTSAIRFSNFCCVHKMENNYYLNFRIMNLRKSKLLKLNIKARLLRDLLLEEVLIFQTIFQAISASFSCRFW